MEKNHMPRTKLNLDKIHRSHGAKLVTVALLLAMCMFGLSMAQQRGQKTFSSPEEASNALLAAAKNNDEKALLDILGADGKLIVSSGDEAEDAQNRADFVQSYQEMHRLVSEPDGTTTLYIGAKNWPTPIPLVNKGNAWFFDTDAGKNEILYRRIGKNELSTIHVCLELVAAQKEYFSAHNEYARKFFSDEDQQNGLYWKTMDSASQSPIGPLVAAAVVNENTKKQDNTPTPYLGYYYLVLTGHGRKDSSGAKNNKAAEEFTFVAYPAEYRSSGVMTFIVNQHGVVYEKDLGTNTGVIAKSMKEYNLNSGWKKSEDQQQETAGVQKNKQ